MCNIDEWFLKHNLRLNFNKTKCMTFTRDKIMQLLVHYKYKNNQCKKKKNK